MFNLFLIVWEKVVSLIIKLFSVNV